jgi:hypothetical protein
MKPKTKEEKQRSMKFEEAVRPLIKYMAENHHPHTVLLIDSTTAHLYEDQMVIYTKEYLVD